MPEPLASRFSWVTWRAAWWTSRAVRRARKDLATTGLKAHVKLPPDLPWGARRGVDAVLRRTEPTCLERSLVLQAWLAAHGRDHDVIVGVGKGADGMKAHAWLDFEGSRPEARAFSPIHKISR